MNNGRDKAHNAEIVVAGEIPNVLDGRMKIKYSGDRERHGTTEGTEEF